MFDFHMINVKNENRLILIVVLNIGLRQVPITNEPRREKADLWGFRPGLTQTDLYCHRSRLEA